MILNLKNLKKHFRCLAGWDIRMDQDKTKKGVSWGGMKGKKFTTGLWAIGLWDRQKGLQPPDYILHEVLHAAIFSVSRMDGRSMKEKIQAEEMLVQDLCSLIMKRR
jgi:hypothetical protein